MGYGAQLAYAGAGADDSFEKLIQRRMAEINQAAAIENMRAQRENEARRIDNDTALRQASLASMDDARKEKAAALQQAQITGALRMAPQGAVIDPALAAKAREIGLGSQLNHQDSALASTSMAGGAMAGGKAPVMGQLRMLSNAGHPERDINLGTADQQQAAQARTDRLAQVEQARQDKIDAAAAAQQGREDLARLAASLHGGNADLQRELLQGKIDAATDKVTEKKQAADVARSAALASIDDTAGALDELIDENGQLKPGVGGAVGWDRLRGSIPGTSAADAKARIDRLQSRLTVDLLGEMKRQSRTGASGFGALSEKELAVLQNAAARLGTSQSDESFRQALVDVRKQLAGMRQRAGGATAVGGAAPIVQNTTAPTNPADLRKRYNY